MLQHQCDTVQAKRINHGSEQVLLHEAKICFSNACFQRFEFLIFDNTRTTFTEGSTDDAESEKPVLVKEGAEAFIINVLPLKQHQKGFTG